MMWYKIKSNFDKRATNFSHLYIVVPGALSRNRNIKI
jgi:hypothetical protein